MNSIASNQFQMAQSLLDVQTGQRLSGIKDPSISGEPIGSEENSDADLEAVAEEFESLFMNMILKSMRTANRAFSEGNYFDTFETRMYEDMLDEKMSTHLSGTHSLGIADMLVQQLRGSVTSSSYGLSMGAASLDEAESVPTRQADFLNPEDFVDRLLPKAQDTARELGIDPRHLVAQAALETGWGSHLMFDQKGRNSHNLFGIKADSEWNGDTVSIESVEVVDGVAVQEHSQFKVYASYEDAIRDYGDKLSGNARYADVLATGRDIDKFGHGLQSGGYATDPEYANKLARVLKNPAFTTIRLAKGVN